MTTIRTPDGTDHEITEVDFEAPEEPWITYKLSDGTVVKFRTMMMSIARSDKFDEHGRPYYFTNSQNQMRTYPSKDVMGKPSPVKISTKPTEQQDNIHGYR